MSEKQRELISPTEISEDAGKTWLSFLRNTIRNHYKILVRLKGEATLVIFDHIDGETIVHTENLDLESKLWELPENEKNKLLYDMPPWKISNIIPPDFVQEKPDTFQFSIRSTEIDEYALFLEKLHIPDKTALTKRKTRNSNKELHRIFSRAFKSYYNKHNIFPQYKIVWQNIYEDVQKDQGTFTERRTYDPNEHIEKIDPGDDPRPILEWVDAKNDRVGVFELKSLPQVLTKLRKNLPLM